MLPPLAAMPYAPLPDIDVIGRVLAGEKQLFELLMRRYNQRLYRAGIAVLGDAEAVEEAMQNAWVKAYEHLSKFEGRASFATWLTRILLNECLMGQRRQRRFVDLDTAPNPTELAQPDERTPLQAVLNDELRQALEAAVCELPAKYRSVFVLRAVEGMNVSETAQSLGLTETNVKVRLLRARAQLRARLGSFDPHRTFAYLGHRCDQMVHTVLARLNETNALSIL
ncbi:RNA polymerase sigma factor [Hymenobacter sp. BT491]|uniref:RNA polymerase sigma factor n=1 Tax=Hymenobacter sp. BT491 TaxID=2766779 RepID=UPI001653552D|nr:RNA polymerase sigma factor [Hymenobacter sp. BT491]MBC6989872.1 RNA polymerase sigma factor [Hymenobacter sp. BT491]